VPDTSDMGAQDYSVHRTS